MRNKKGLSHVEVLISFALFITLLTLIFVFIKPIREPSLSNVLLDIAENELKKEATIALVTLPFNAPTSGCISIPNPLRIGQGLGEDDVFITDKDGNFLPFEISGAKMKVDGPGGLYYINYAFDGNFGSHHISGPCDNEMDVTFSAPRVDTYLSFDKLKVIEGKYISDYDTLKAGWFFPEKSGFSISIEGDSINIEMKKDPPQGKNVYARTITLNVLQNKEIKQVDIDIRVW